MYRAFAVGAFSAVIVVLLPGVSRAQDWSGPYAGVHAGVRWSSLDLSTPAFQFSDGNGGTLQVPADRRSFNFSGGIGGAHGGYNFLIGGGWLIGIEGDFSWGRDGRGFGEVFRASRTETSTRTVFTTRTITEVVSTDDNRKTDSKLASGLYDEGEQEVETVTRTIRVPRTITSTRTINSRAIGNSNLDLKGQGTIRTRLGFVQGNFLYYVTTGVAFTQVDWSHTINIAGGDRGTASKSDTLVGFVVGTGAETFVAPQMLLRLEYLYEDFGSMSVPFAFTNTTGELDVTVHKLRLGLSWKF